MTDENSSTATADINLNLSVPDGIDMGLSGSLVFGNDFDPDDGILWQWVDSVIPDDVGVVVSFSGGDGVSLGGRVSATATAYPNLSPIDVMEAGDSQVSLTAMGYTGHVVVSNENEIVGAGAGVGLGLGISGSQSMNSAGLLVSGDPFDVRLVWGDTVYSLTGANHDEANDTPSGPSSSSNNSSSNDDDDRDPITVTTTSGSGSSIVTVDSTGTTATDNTTGEITTSSGTNVVLSNGDVIIHGVHYDSEDPIFDDNPATIGTPSSSNPPASDPNSPPPGTLPFDDLGTTGPRPIVMDLDGDGVELSFGDGPRFDWDSDGFLEQGSWAAADDGFLVIDLDANGNRNSSGGDGLINNADEVVWTNLLEESDFNDFEAYLWGLSQYFGLSCHTDLEALNLLERRDDWGNGDGVLDSSDEVWSELRVWQDVNQNGITDEGELVSLDELGITEIELTYDDGTAFDDTSNDLVVFGNTLSGLASFTRNGEVVEGGVGDLSLEVDENGVRATEGVDGVTYTFEDGSDSEFVAVMSDDDTDFTNNADGRDDLIGVRGSNLDDLIDLRGVASGQFINGSGGADVVRGSDYEDIIMGGEGNDTLSGHRGRDVLIGEDGNDRLYGGNGHDQLEGGAGTDRLYGGNGDDILNAGEGTGSWQYLYGGNGDDTYVYETSAGHVFISGDEGATTGTEDGVVFGDLRIQDISFSMHDYGSGHISGNAINFSWSENGESGRLRIGLGGQHIEEYIFADGSRFNAVVAAETGVASSGRSQFVGADSDDLIVNVDNTNAYYLIGGDGDDTLVATVDGAGNNYLGGQSGDDTYVYHQSAGNTWITVWGEATDANGSNDTFVFADLYYADVTFSTYNSGSAQGEVLQANFVDEGVTHYVRFADQGSAIENFEFADGATLSSYDLIA